MKREELFELHQRTCQTALDLMVKKNADYSGGEDALGNFYGCEAIGAASAEMGVLTRMTDKMSRLASIIKRGEASVTSESEDDTLIDLINYSVLMLALRRDRCRKSSAQREWTLEPK